MKIIGYEFFKYTSKKDNKEHTCFKYYLAIDVNDEKHQGLTAPETGYIFDFTKEQAQRISEYFKNGTDLIPLYNKRGNLTDVSELRKK